MTFSPNVTLYLALGLYAVGTLIALVTLFRNEILLQRAGMVVMGAGWISHTVWRSRAAPSTSPKATRSTPTTTPTVQRPLAAPWRQGCPMPGVPICAARIHTR